MAPLTDRPARLRRRLSGISVVALVLLTVGCASVSATTPSPVASATSTTDASDGSRVLAGIPFATVSGVTLRLDACVPKGDGDAPGLVIVPGGGFTERTRDWLRPECMDGAAHGYATFVVDYRLADEGAGGHSRFPDQIEDVERAIRWISSAAERGIVHVDTTDMVLLGESAGAIIASEIAVRSPGATLPESTFRGVVLLSGVYDFGLADLTPTLRSIATDYFGCSPSASCRPTVTASAARYAAPGDPPMLLINAKAELVWSDQMTTFAARLTKAKVQHQTILAPSYHAIDIARHYPKVRAAMWRFIGAHLQR